MQEWMIAMLVISIMLIIRDMAKTILAENLPDTEELPSLQEGHPQKERVEKYAASFQKLADTFYGMPYRKDYLSSRQVEQIIEDTNAKVCSRCLPFARASRVLPKVIRVRIMPADSKYKSIIKL